MISTILLTLCVILICVIPMLMWWLDCGKNVTYLGTPGFLNHVKSYFTHYDLIKVSKTENDIFDDHDKWYKIQLYYKPDRQRLSHIKIDKTDSDEYGLDSGGTGVSRFVHSGL